MIWSDGRILQDDELKVSVLDRTFEHGLGLFETLRTWNGVAPLLDRHLERLDRSSIRLGVPIQTVPLPDAAAVASLVKASGLGGEVMLRITLTGGTPDGRATLWMAAKPLPEPVGPGGATVGQAAWWRPIESCDPLAQHKSLNYLVRRMAYDWARVHGFDEVLAISSDWQHVWEGSRTNVFVVRSSRLITPPIKEFLLIGIMRSLVLYELAKGIGVETEETMPITLSSLMGADEVFLTNSVRGIIPVGRIRLVDRKLGRREWPAPGPITRRLMDAADAWFRTRSQPPR